MVEAGRKRLIIILVIMLVYTIGLLVVLSFCTQSRTSDIPTSPPIESVPLPEPIPPTEPSLEPMPIEEPPSEPDQIVEVVVPEEPVRISEPIEEPEPTVIVEEPVVMDQGPPVEEEPWIPEPVSEEPEEDPWADFYVAGEEDLSIFEDGAYYVPLFVNSEYLTDINVIFSQEQLLIEVAEFRTIISDLLIDSFEEELFNTTEQYFSLDYLNSREIESRYDYQTFELYMDFPTWMMPTRILSINQGNITRYSSYSMGGSSFIDPEPFTWFANVSAYSLLDVAAADSWKIQPNSLFTLQSRNSVSLFDVAFDFSYTFHPGRAYNEITDLWSDDFADYITFQGIQGFYDYKPKSLRFIFGNVNDYLGYSTDSFGLAVEKRYNYGDAEPKGHQFQYEVVVEEPSIVEVFINEKSVYRRELQAGIYQLRDFIFSQGANFARVVVEPLADSALKEEYEFVIGYDSRLLSRGDTLYSAGLSFPDYDIGKTTFRVNQQFGFTDEITTSYALAFSPSGITFGLSNLFATQLGSIDVSLASSYNAPLRFGWSGNVGYRIAGKEDAAFGAFTVSSGFSTDRYTSSLNVPADATANPGHAFDLGLSFSGKVGEKVRYTLSGSLNWITNNSRPNWRLTVSTGLPLIPRMSVSGSVSLYATPTITTPQIRGQIGLSYAFNPNISMSATSNITESVNASASWRPFGSTNNNVNFSLSGIRFDDPLNHQGSISYSRSGNAYGLSLRQQYSDRFERFSTSLSMNTAFAYAGGLVGITRSIADNFLLVKPGGALKGSDIAVTRTMSSAPSALPRLFGVGTYTQITTHDQNNVVIYGIGDSLMGSNESFIYDFLPRPRQGYAVKISSEVTYSIVGTLLKSPSAAYSRYAADLARVVTDEDGNEVLELDETLYLFTDENGFFYLGGVKEGEYQFSIFLPGSGEEDPPIDVRFIIEELDTEAPMVLVLDDFVASDIAEALDIEMYEDMMGNPVKESILDEDGYYWLNVKEVMDEIDFWDNYYPARQVLDSVSSIEPTTDAFVEFISPDTIAQDSALVRMRREQELRLFNLARLREIVKPYLDAITPKDGWRPEIR